MSADELLNYSYDRILFDIDIDKAFDSYRKALFNQYQKMDDEIYKWGESIISEIRENRTEQSRLLKQEYESQRHYLEKKRQEYIDEAEAHIHKKKKNDEQIDQLMARCNALKFELATFKYPTRKIPYIILITQENLAHEQPKSRSKGDQDNETINSVHATKSSPFKLIHTNIEQKRRYLIAKPPNEKNQSMIYRDDLIEECPICYMTFSANVAPDDRSAHVNEHFSSD